MSNYINNLFASKSIHSKYIYLINYYYIIEDSIKGSYQSAVEYWYPPPQIDSNTYQDFELVDIDDCNVDEPDNWFAGNMLKSIRESVYIPSKEHTMEELENSGYFPLIHNKLFSEQPWNCLITDCDNCKFDILTQIMSHWDIKKVDLHIISGPYEDDSFEQYKKFTTDLDSNSKIQNTYLRKFDKDDYHSFIDGHESDFKFWKTEHDTIHITILDNPNFEIKSEDINPITGNNKYFIVFQKKLEPVSKYVDYIVTPSNNIKKIQDIFPEHQYPTINDTSIYSVIPHPNIHELNSQLNYIRL